VAAVKSAVLAALADLASADAQAWRGAREGLLEAADPDTIEAIVDALSATSWRFRANLVAVLAEIGGSAIPALESAIVHGVWYVRAAAAEALALIQGEDSFEALTPLLSDPSVGVREAVGRGLARGSAVEDPARLVERLRPFDRAQLLPFLKALRREREELYAQILSLRPDLGPGGGP